MPRNSQISGNRLKDQYALTDKCKAGKESDKQEDYKRIEVAKQIVGSGKLLVDTNASWDAQTALSFAPELARLGVAWLEEPIPFEDIEGMKKLNAAVPQLHVIGCETQQGVKNFQHMAQEDAISIVQPDGLAASPSAERSALWRRR